jgi:hypothetical protein
MTHFNAAQNVCNHLSSSNLKPSYRDRFVNLPPKLPEHYARDRRLTEFEKAGNLTEVLHVSPRHTAIRHLIQGHVDHISYWVFEGTPIVMNEPYQGQLSDYQTDGLAAIELPHEIAPYCGRVINWDSSDRAKPNTKTFLICKAVSAKKLQKLLERLSQAAANMPRWNI